MCFQAQPKSTRPFLSLAAAALTLLTACGQEPQSYRQAMRDFVMAIDNHAGTRAPGFLIIPQNGEELLALGDSADAPPAHDYLMAIDGQGREDLWYGYLEDDERTPAEETEAMGAYLDNAAGYGVRVLVTDYCWTEAHMAASYEENERRGYLSFAAPARNLDTIPQYPPQPHAQNTDEVSDLAQARNFLYLLDPSRFATLQDYLAALTETTYDLFILDAFFDNHMLTAEEVAGLKTKPGGAKRLVIAYMSIGEAEEYRYYWRENWRPGRPGWLLEENPDWQGNYKVRYWDPQWQAIILGSPGAYLDRILDAGFDGVYLDLIDAYEYFE